MRRYARVALSARASRWLERNSDQLVGDRSISVSSRWSARRQTMNNNGIVDALARMCGAKRRCMYCGDSEACDIEHFYPKSMAEFRGRVFRWDNFLFICAPCNRLKNNSFKLTNDGLPLLLNPIDDDPWEFFDYVEETGALVPRYDLPEDRRRRAESTLDDATSRLSFEVIVNARMETVKGLRRAIRVYMNSERSVSDRLEMVEDVARLGRPELVQWYLSGASPACDEMANFVISDYELVAEIKHRISEMCPGMWN